MSYSVYGQPWPEPPPPPESLTDRAASRLDGARNALKDGSPERAQANGLIAIGYLLTQIEQHLAQWNREPPSRPGA